MTPSRATSPAGPADVVFRIDRVSKSYPGVQALSDVSLEGRAGEVLAICGANGAGKSTLARLLAGQEQPSSGRVSVTGYSGTIDSPSAALSAGVLLMHQEPVVIDTFTLEENVWLRSLSATDSNAAWRRRMRPDPTRTREALAAVGMADTPLNTLGAQLGPGQRQMLALSRAVVSEHSVLLLDETTASSTEEHFKDVQALVEREKAAGVSIVFVSHRMPEVFALADRIAVLRGGRLIDIVETDSTTHEDVLSLMIGEGVAALEPPVYAPDPTREPIVRLHKWEAGSARNIDLEVGPGEVVGVYGLVGSGRSSLARSISGHQQHRSGVMMLNGTTVHPTSPRDALARGIVYVSEDRKREGFVPEFTNGRNLTLATLDQNSRFGVLDMAAERRRVAELIRRYQVKGGGDGYTRALSGGNQQKVCIAKWLEADPDFVVLDEPTKGIDVGSRMNIYEIIRDLAAQGRGILVVTSEAEEALMLCSRVLVLRDGHIVEEFNSSRATTDDLIRASLGGNIA